MTSPTPPSSSPPMRPSGSRGLHWSWTAGSSRPYEPMVLAAGSPPAPQILKALLRFPAQEAPRRSGRELVVGHVGADEERLVGPRQGRRAEAVEERRAGVFPARDEGATAVARGALAGVAG